MGGVTNICRVTGIGFLRYSYYAPGNEAFGWLNGHGLQVRSPLVKILTTSEYG